MCRNPSLVIGQRGETRRAGHAVAGGPDSRRAGPQRGVGDDAGGVVDHAGGLQTEVFHLRRASRGNQNLVRLDLEPGALKVTMSGDPLAVARRRDALHDHAGLDAYPLLGQQIAQGVDQLRLLSGRSRGFLPSTVTSTPNRAKI